ncbi:MAG: hypothetical protein ACRDNB_04815 [Gaiellaceae bacterium]
MKRIYLPLLAFLVAVPAAAALDRAQTQALVRLAQSASGLHARKPVRVVFEQPAPFARRRIRLLDRGYPRAAREHDETVYRALGLLAGDKGVLRRTLIELEDRRGLYDPVARTAYVRKGAGERAAALHEIVHALQDQRHDLRRLARLPGGRDAARAATAVVDGHASLVADVLARRPASRGGSRLTRFLELERGFASAVGTRFAADLRNLGGNRALLGALARLPATSEQVFHLDKYLERERAAPIVLPTQAAGLALASDETFGELDVRALLAVFGVPRLDRVGSGWGGGRSAVYGDGDAQAVLVALGWDTELDAGEWAEAAALYVDEAFDAAAPGLPAPVACDADVCWDLGGTRIAFAREGVRTGLALAATVDAAAELATASVGR